MKKTILVVPLLLTALILAGCAQNTPAPADDGASSAPFVEDPSIREAENLISIKDFAFSPESVTVKAGATVTWINDEEAMHRIVFQNLYDSGNLNKGESFTVTFDKVGTFDYFCLLHSSMKGTIIVE